MSVYIGDVQTFAGVIADKPQVLKIGEETMEVFSAWEDYKYAPEFRKEALIAEIADVIQAACNLLAAIGVDDMRQPMQACYVRNNERGREYANDTFSAESDAKPQSVDANDENVTQDSREQLEDDIDEFGRRFIACELRDIPLVDVVRCWLDRQAAITAIEVARERYDIERDLTAARDELQEALNAAAGKWAKADARCSELKAENEALKTKVETLRSKLSKMLDAASTIQHIGDLP